MNSSNSRKTDRRLIGLCVALLLIAIAAMHPHDEMGFEDAWSYAHIARDFAFTGRLNPNGFYGSLMLPQFLWSALFIRLFGFSFMVLQLSTVLIAVAMVPVLYLLGRQCGLTHSSSVFGTLLTSLSPLVIPVTATYMSDVPSLAFFVACLYCAVNATRAQNRTDCIIWSAVTAIASVACALNRQIYWPAPVFFLPVIAWMQRAKRSVPASLFVMWIAVLATFIGTVEWVVTKPYFLREPTIDAWLVAHPIHILISFFTQLIDYLLTGSLILLPLLFAFVVPAFRMMSRARFLLIVAAVLVADCVLSMFPHHSLLALGNIITAYGVQPSWHLTSVMGKRELVLNATARNLLTVAVLLGAACFGGLFLSAGRRRFSESPAFPLAIFGVVFTAAWTPALLFRSLLSEPYDRYLMSFLPFAFLLLRFYQTAISTHVPRTSWAALLVFALYGVLTSHDAFAIEAARFRAAQNLERSGVSRTDIDAGVEYDGWTQLETEGHVNSPQIENPPRGYRRVTCSGPHDLSEWYRPFMPAVHARYFVELSRSPELIDSSAIPVGYTTWLPYGRRRIVTQVLPSGAREECH